MTAGASQLCKLIIGLAREEGFRPIAIVRRDDQIPLLKQIGAAHVLNEKAPDFRDALREVLKAEPAAHLPRCGDRAGRLGHLRRHAEARALDHLRQARPVADDRSASPAS